MLTLIAGLLPAYFRLPHGRWLELHYELMNWSYVGLVAAALSEGLTRLPSAPFWPAVALSALVVFFAGGILIARGRSRYRFEAMANQSHQPMNFAEALRRRRACAACN